MFSLRTTFGAITIIIADVIISFAVFLLFLSILFKGPAQTPLCSNNALLVYSFFTLVIILSLGFSRLYSSMEYIYPIDLVKRIIPAFFLSFGGIASIGFFVQCISVLNWRIIPPLVFIYLILFAFRFFLFYAFPENREFILILGYTEQAREIIRESQRKKYKGYQIIGILTSLDNQVGLDFKGVPILGPIKDVGKIRRDREVKSIVVTLRDRRGKLEVNELLKCKMENVRIQDGFSFYEKLKRQIIIDEYLKPSWFVFESGFFHTSLHGAVKRAQGMIISFAILTIFSPVLIIIAILIKLDSRGPVLFYQERVGRHGKIFKLLKFRSMYTDAEKKRGPQFATKGDPRITKIGKFIRRFRIDEIPQLINIFMGDMDLVGPRPERPIFVMELEKIVPYYELRHAVRPGLSGWAQVNYKYGESFKDSQQKLTYDLYYVKHFSWFLDLLIIFMTIKEVLFGRGQ